jgi:two-component system, NtrC family, sensor kinase
VKRLIIILQLIGSLYILCAQSNNANTSGYIETSSQLLKALRDSPNFDSLKKKAIADSDNETRAITLFAITAQYLNIKLDSSLKYIKQFNDIPSKSKLWEANGSTIMGDIYLRLGNVSLALENLLKGTKLLQELNDSAGLGMAYWNLGKLYQGIDDSQTAINYYSNAIKIASLAKENVPWTYSLGHLGHLYMELNQLDSALYYTQSAYELRMDDRNNYDPILLAQLGNIYQKKGNTSLAKLYYRMALEKASPVHNLNAGSDACIGLALLFKKENRYDSCLFYSREGFSLAKQLNKPDLIWKASQFLKDLFKEKGILDSAFNYQEIMIAANDSLRSLEKINKVHTISFAEQQRIAETKTREKEFQNKIRQFVLIGSLAVFLIIAALLYRNNMHKQKANTLLQQQKQEIQRTLTELKSTQAQLIQSEKMASLGELTAGIAHEIQNPLNFVNNFSEVSAELLNEMITELGKNNKEGTIAIADDVKQNLEKILHHGKRADAIVKGMLQHSPSNSGQKEPTAINALCDEYLRLAYHGQRAKDKSFNATMKTDFDETIGNINIIPQDIGRVVLNLINNAFYAVDEKKKQQPGGYEPTVSLSTKKINGKVEISVKDNGNGIPQKVLDKIFQPFFTTKPTGQGTGLGLSLAYDIVKAHGGELKVETKEGEGTAFSISLPVNQ